ncbi:unnamed protein product, partial [Mesorhabditis belari]|uniref:F-box domain-containing protein n=1 Tax=Mesorhabditis belari TaxID=2138241 RepID=A0AAF3EP43_9BILA
MEYDLIIASDDQQTPSFQDNQTQLMETVSESGTAALLAVMSLHEDGTDHKMFRERLECFHTWPQEAQIAFVKTLIRHLKHPQLAEVAAFLTPLLQRDFIAALPSCAAEHVLQYLDAPALSRCEAVSKNWQRVIAESQMWKRLIEAKARGDPLWRGLMKQRDWLRFIFSNRDNCINAICSEESIDPKTICDNQTICFILHRFFRKLYPKIVKELANLETNWRNGTNHQTLINCNSENSKGVYCLQYDDDKIVSGLRDNTIKVWHRNNLSIPSLTLTGHTGSVLCLQYDQRIIVSGSSDGTIRIWDIHTGECLNTLIHHAEAVLHLRFGSGRMVTCSKDRTVVVWEMTSPKQMSVQNVLSGHRAAVNVVDFDETYIVSASGDRTIKVWGTDDCAPIRTLTGHRRGIACLQYKGKLIVSGSSDNTIRVWDIDRGACIRVLEGHDELVRCLRFDSKRIVSGAYDGKIKIWDMEAALDPNSTTHSLCLATLNRHTGRVFRLQFDDFQVVSSSHDDTIIVWDFLSHCPLLPSALMTTCHESAPVPIPMEHAL